MSMTPAFSPMPASILPDPGLLGDLGELLEVHLGGLVGAVLAPHHRVHRQLRAGRPAARGSRGSGRTRRPSGPARPTAARGSGSVAGDGRRCRGGRGGGSGARGGAGLGHGINLLGGVRRCARTLRGGCTGPNASTYPFSALLNYIFVIHSFPVTGVNSGVRVIVISRHSWRFRCFPEPCPPPWQPAWSRPCSAPCPARRRTPPTRSPRATSPARLRPVRGPEPVRDVDLDQEVAVPGRRHLHLRQLPRLPHADEPDPDLGAQPARRRLAPDADHARPAGVLLDALPALRQEHRPDDHPERRRTPTTPRAARAGPRPARPSTTAQRLGIVRGQHAVLRPRGVRHPHEHDLHVLGAVVPHRLDPPAARPRLRVRLLLERRVGHPDAGRPPGRPRTARSTMPDQVWIADWNGKANTSSSYIRSDGWLPYGRMKQYQGGHNETYGGVTDQHRPQLPQPADAEDPRREHSGAEADSRSGTRRRRSTPAPRPATRAARRRRSPAATTRPSTRARSAALTVPLQCLLKQQHLYKYEVTGHVEQPDPAALNSFQASVGLAKQSTTSAAGPGRPGHPRQQPHPAARRDQECRRGAGAAGDERRAGPRLAVSGTYRPATQRAVKAYQRAGRAPGDRAPSPPRPGWHSSAAAR